MNFLKKYNELFLIARVIAFIVMDVMWFYDFAIGKETLWLIGGIIFALLALFQIEELYLYYKNRKIEKLKTGNN